MDDKTREHLTAVLDHELDLTRRGHETNYRTLLAKCAKDGLLNSGVRIRRAVGLMATALNSFQETAVAEAQRIAASAEAFDLAASYCHRLMDDFEQALPSVVVMGRRAPTEADQRPLRAAKELTAQIAADLTTRLRIARFEFELRDDTARPILPMLEASEDELPLWINMAQATAWIRYQTADAMIRIVSAEAVAADTLYGKEARQSRDGDLVQALQAGEITAYGATSASTVLAPISPQQWAVLPVTTLDSARQFPFVKILTNRLELQRRFPAPDATKTPTRPALPEAKLREWWSKVATGGEAMSLVAIHAAAAQAFPEHFISRDRIRDLAPGRKRGRRQSAIK
jgi:hypothetical protein